MHKQIFILLFYFSCFQTFAQQFEVGGGMNRNKYFNWGNDEGHQQSTFYAKNGYSFFISADITFSDTIHTKFSLTLDNYTGSFHSTSSYHFDGSSTTAEVNKTTLGLIFYPVNIRIAKQGWINFGLSFNLLLDYTLSGTHENWYINGRSSQELDSKYINDFTVGLTSRAAYQIRIIDKWYIVPQYSVYLGLSNEFNHTEVNILSFRQYFELGIMTYLH